MMHIFQLCYSAATCSGRKDLSAPDGSSNYTATWRARNERVEFELTGLGQSWVGIGFSHDQKMVNKLVLMYYSLLL